MSEHKKQCPICHKYLYYKQKSHLNESIRKNRKCAVCAVKGNKLSDSTKKKLSFALKNRIMSEETKKKISIKTLGNKRSLGFKASEETKTKLRIIYLKRLERLGISPCIDEGAPEWFEKYNKENNTNFVPKTLWGNGYAVDGYDEKLHSVIEFDTLYHNTTYQKRKDLIRQNNIIKYFEGKEEPLVSFKRYTVWDNEIKTVYNGAYGI